MLKGREGRFLSRETVKWLKISLEHAKIAEGPIFRPMPARLGTSIEESIALKTSSGKKITLLEYEPSGGIAGCRGQKFLENQEPSVDWSDASVIRISISVMTSVR